MFVIIFFLFTLFCLFLPKIFTTMFLRRYRRHRSRHLFPRRRRHRHRRCHHRHRHRRHDHPHRQRDVSIFRFAHHKKNFMKRSISFPLETRS